jgi:hypothetical protein
MKRILTVLADVDECVHMAIIHIGKGIGSKIDACMFSRKPFLYGSKKLVTR